MLFGKYWLSPHFGGEYSLSWDKNALWKRLSHGTCLSTQGLRPYEEVQDLRTVSTLDRDGTPTTVLCVCFFNITCFKLLVNLCSLVLCILVNEHQI